MFGFSFLLFFAYLTGSVQASSPVTPSGLNTKVSDPFPTTGGRTQYDITGGMRPGGGLNLYHSFDNFSVPTNNIANFLNDSGLATANVLGRVTGGNLSSIFGTIQTTGFGSANLFLINPAGFLFGPNAQVHVGGMVSFTSADYVRLADGVRFNAVPDAAADALLSTAPVSAYGFLGSNPGAITIQGTQLTVANGSGISLVGGNITIQSGTPDGGTPQSALLHAPNGKIQLATAASPGEFDAATLQPVPNVNMSSFTSFGSASLAPGSNINVSHEQTVSIRGGQFVLAVNDAVLSTAPSPGPTATISLSPGSSMISSNGGTHAGADVQLIASNVQLDGASIQSLTFSAGTGGNISITTAPDGGPNSSTDGSVQMTGGQIQTASVGPGTVGNIAIKARDISMTDGALIDTMLVSHPLIPGQPQGATIAITATDSIFVTGQRSGTTNFLPSVPGLPTFTNMPSGIYSENVSANAGSRIVIQTPRLTLQPGEIGSHAFGAGAAGDISLLLGQATLKDGGFIGSAAFGAGASASIDIRASDSITMSGFLPGTVQVGPVALQNVGSNISIGAFGSGQAGHVLVFTPTLTMDGPTSIASSSLGSGGAGDVHVTAGTITMTGGAAIDTSTFGPGPGGSVSVTASDHLSISGRSGQSVSFGEVTAADFTSVISASTFGPGKAGAVTVSTPILAMSEGGQISTVTSGDGAAGSIVVDAATINLSSGASISSSSGLGATGGRGFFQMVGNGAGGTVTVNATGPVTIAGQGSGLFTSTMGNGAGGNIHLSANSVALQDGAQLSSNSAGNGEAGDIMISAGTQLKMVNSSITTEANQSSGGAIKITTNPNGIVQVSDSIINASVLDGTGGGGSINIDPQFVLLQNSQILANAVFGPGGNISITTNLLLPDNASVISASSQFGQNGTISVQSPISPASGKIIPLPQKPLIATTLLSQRCAALTHANLSSFTIVGRDSLPAEPGGWLSSPLALAYIELVGSTLTEPDTRKNVIDTSEEPAMVSLRRMTPPGFLTQAFAAGSSTGCKS
jgi:filamentous hemagglutinin family protein